MSEQQIFAKCAWRLIPLMGVLYLVNFIDRTNAGFAALTMNKDLSFSPSIFGFGAGVFFIGYALFQVPANIILERIGARRWMFFIMASWGLLSASNALVQSPTSFYVLRFFVGVAEAGFFPGMIVYLTYWFPRSYLAGMTANFMVAIPLSFVVGGPLASWVLQLNGVAGLHGWQWLFIVEGAPAFFLSFMVLVFLPDGPAQASWLTSDEKGWVASRLTDEQPPGRPDLWLALRDPRVISLGIAYFAFQTSIYGFVLWFPQIVQAMGFSNSGTGFIVSFCFVASIPTMILVGRSSSKRREGIWHATVPWLAAAASIGTASMAQSPMIILFALALALMGMLAGLVTFSVLPASFLRGTAVAGAIGLVGLIGNFGSFFGPTLVGVLREGTGDFGTGLAALAFGFALSAVIVLGVGRLLLPRLLAQPTN
jgi:ACS family tartrate transporter-like MFS transporter